MLSSLPVALSPVFFSSVVIPAESDVLSDVVVSVVVPVPVPFSVVVPDLEITLIAKSLSSIYLAT